MPYRLASTSTAGSRTRSALARFAVLGRNRGLGWGLSLVACLFFLLFGTLAQGQAAAPAFVDTGILLGEVTTGACAWADFDNDGDPDLLLTRKGADGPLLRLYRNDRDQFTEFELGLPGLVSVTFAVADYDNDGLLDFAVQGGELDSRGFATARTYLCHNQGALTFSSAPLPAQYAVSLSWGDYDGDGDLDLLHGGTLYQNLGAGNLTDSGVVLPASLQPLTWLDYDGDGDVDLVPLHFESGGQVSFGWIRNDGPNGFSARPLSFPDNTSSLWKLAWQDWDGDGDLDVVGNPYLNIPVVLRNDGAAGFIRVAAPTALSAAAAAWGDADNDGDWDILFTGNSYTSSDSRGSDILLNTGTGIFARANLDFTAGYGGEAAWADYDQDGDLDFVLVSSCLADGCFPTRLFRSELALSNRPPTAPSGLAVAMQPDGTVRLSWSPSTDRESLNQRLLTYDVEVLSQPMLTPVLLAPADRTTGLRRVPAPGRARATEWLLRDLPVGSYRWRVQAVDTALAGSPFSAAATFTVSNVRPNVSSIPDQTNAVGVATPPIPFTISDDATPAGALTVTVSSSNPILLPPGSGFVLGGAGNNRTLVLVPAANVAGDAEVTVTVRDGGGFSSSQRFHFVAEWFSLVDVGLAVAGAQAIAWPNLAGDFDSDGDLDFLTMVTAPGLGTITAILVNEGGNRFRVQPAGQGVPLAYGATAFDYDRDGHLDLLLDLFGEVRLYRNNGSGDFQPTSVRFPGMPVLGDLEHDGDADALFARCAGSNPTCFTGLFENRAGQWFELPTLPGETPVEAWSWVDVTGDGYPEVQVGARLFRNLGNGVLGPPLPAFLSSGYGTLAFDADNDGDVDLLSMSFSPTLERNDGTGTFTSTGTGLAIMQPVAFGDFDQDGHTDLLCRGKLSFAPDEPNVIFIERNNGNGQFSELLHLPASPQFVVSPGDFDNDGDLDLLVVNTEKVQLYRNNTTRRIARVNVPHTLSSTPPADNRVRLNWRAPFTNGFTFNLRVGTRPNAADVVASDSDPSSGYRRLLQPGNARTATHYELQELPPGTYYWSVQSVNAALAGSAWSEEQTFTVTKPVIAVVDEVVTPPGVPSQPISLSVTSASFPAATLLVSAEALDSDLLPVQGIQFSGSGSTRFLILTPAARIGLTVVRVRVTDPAGNSDWANLLVRVERFSVTALPTPFSGSFSGHGPAAWLDLDWDGDLDLASHGYAPGLNHTQLYRNLGGGRFEAAARLAENLSWDTLVTGDADRDNHPDLLLSGFAQGNDGGRWANPRYQGLALNTGDFELVAEESGISRLWGYQTGGGAYWLDANQDGGADIVLWGNTGTNRFEYAHRTLAFPLTPLGSFAEPLPPLLDYSPAGIAWADFDRDGSLDLATGNGLYHNDGTGHFSLTESGLPAKGGHWSTADFDADGWPDLLLLEGYSFWKEYPPQLYRNLGDGTFREATNNLPILVWGVGQWGDLDNDGRTDLILQSGGWLGLYHNNGDGTFAPLPADLPPISSFGLTVADADADNDLDLLLGGEDHFNGVLFLARNNSSLVNQPPAAPSNLRTTPLLDGVLLEWDAPTDRETPSAALTYNVRVGITPGGSEIMSALAHPTTGRRFVAGRGNAGSAPRWRLNQGERRTYYWSVQAIDAAEAGGAFAPEATFRISALPTVSGIPNQTLRPDQTLLEVQFTIADEDTPLQELVVSATSSDQTIVPDANLELQGAGSNRLLRLRTLPQHHGTTTIAVTVRDDAGQLVRTEFTVTVLPFFTEMPRFAPPLQYPMLAWVDADNDGRLDLFMSGLDTLQGRAQLQQNSNGRLTNVMAVFNPLYRGQAVWGHLNGDNLLDLLFVGSRSELTPGRELHFNRFPAGFAASVSTSLPSLARSAAALGDYDGDGDLDVLVAGRTASSLTPRRSELYRNDGTGNFTLDSSLILPGLDHAAAVWADYDGDGDLDFLLSGSTNGLRDGAITLLGRNDGAGGFAVLTGQFPGLFEGTISWADYNLDGRPDLLLSGETPGPPVTILYRNLGQGSLVAVPTPLPPIAHGDIAWGDYDADGDPDLLVTGQTSAGLLSAVFENDRGQFGERPVWTGPGLRDSAVAWGDVDQDGNLDFVIAGASDSPGNPVANYLFRNQRLIPPPSVRPQFTLNAEVNGSTVLLSWTDSTSPVAQSYNVRVGTTPDSSELLRAPADANGRLQVPQAGNAGWSGRWLLHNLGAGTYFWSVQAVDAAFRGSPFSASATFTVVNHQPRLTALPDVNVPMNSVPAPMTFMVTDLDSSPEELAVSVHSSNPALLPNENLRVSGTGPERTLTLICSTNRSGTALVTVTVRDPHGGSAFDTFRLTVEPLAPASSLLDNALPVTLQPADYDDDGDLDLLFAGWEFVTPTVRLAKTTLLESDGRGQFTPALSSLPATYSEAFAAWGDYDGDGDLDILFTGTVYRNDAGTFVPVWSQLQNIESGAAAWGDYDQDGDLDFAICGHAHPITTRIYRNDGNDQFTDIGATLLGVWLGALTWCDTDNDGDLDLFVTGAAAELVAASPVARLYRNDNGVFNEDNNGGEPFFGVVGGKVACADVNHDGHPDLLYAGVHGLEPTVVFRVNDGFHHFISRFLKLNSFLPGIALTDWDTDGDLDMVQHSSTALAVYLNNGNGEFDNAPIISVNAKAEVLCAAPFDEDLDPDLIVGVPDSEVLLPLKFVRNLRGPAPRTLVDRPTALVEGNSVRLAWPEAPAEPNGRALALTYNLRVGSRPGGTDVLSPMAHPSTGRRLLPQAGNAGPLTFHQLRELLPGTYWWAVQSVTASWRAGAFSGEETFVIPPRILSLVQQPDGQLRLLAQARANTRVIIEQSDELASGWRLATTLDVNDTGLVEWLFPASSQARFFRLR